MGIPMLNGTGTGIGEERHTVARRVPIRFLPYDFIGLQIQRGNIARGRLFYGRPNGGNGFSVTPNGTPYCG